MGVPPMSLLLARMSAPKPSGLSLLPHMLRSQYDGNVPPYRVLYTDAVNGRFPATWQNGRWYWLLPDLPQIASTYDLRPKSEDTPQAA